MSKKKCDPGKHNLYLKHDDLCPDCGGTARITTKPADPLPAPAESGEVADGDYSYEETGGDKSWNDTTEVERLKYKINKQYTALTIRKKTIDRLQEKYREAMKSVEHLTSIVSSLPSPP